MVVTGPISTTNCLVLSIRDGHYTPSDNEKGTGGQKKNNSEFNSFNVKQNSQKYPVNFLLQGLESVAH